MAVGSCALAVYPLVFLASLCVFMCGIDASAFDSLPTHVLPAQYSDELRLRLRTTTAGCRSREQSCVRDICQAGLQDNDDGYHAFQRFCMDVCERQSATCLSAALRQCRGLCESVEGECYRRFAVFQSNYRGPDPCRYYRCDSSCA